MCDITTRKGRQVRMTTFEDILCKGKNAAECVGKKASDIVEVTKLKMEAAEMEKDIAATLEGLGRLVYDSRKRPSCAARSTSTTR